jgi:hypothetical protein
LASIPGTGVGFLAMRGFLLINSSTARRTSLAIGPYIVHTRTLEFTRRLSPI